MPNYIEEWRKKRGFKSLERLAKAIEDDSGYKTDKTQLSRLENGKRKLTQQWLERLAGPLGGDPGELLGPPPEDLPPYVKSSTDVGNAGCAETSATVGESENLIYNEEVGSQAVTRDQVAFQILELIPAVSVDVLITVRNILHAAPKKGASNPRVGSRSNP